MNYDLNTRRLAVWNLKTHQRLPKMLALLFALTIPFQVLHDMFMRYRSHVLYQLALTPQVASLRKMLNDSYDPVQRRINISPATQKNKLYLYRADENKPKYLGTLHLYRRNETVASGLHFIVLVPASIAFDEQEMRGRIDAQKLPDKKYIIQKTR
jgi:hypothetical protein